MESEINQESFQEVSITIEEAGYRTLKMVVPFLLICGVPFFVIHGWTPLEQISFACMVLFILSGLVGIIIHELIHALVFALFSLRGFSSIRFGMDRKTLSPYCHPVGIIKVWVYRLGALAPLVVLGLVPLIISFFLGNIAFLLFGFIFSIAAGGDIISVWMTRGLSKSDIIMDHQSKLGFYIISREQK